jgi:hypothetical protein
MVDCVGGDASKPGTDDSADDIWSECELGGERRVSPNDDLDPSLGEIPERGPGDKLSRLSTLPLLLGMSVEMELGERRGTVIITWSNVVCILFVFRGVCTTLFVFCVYFEVFFEDCWMLDGLS